MKFRHFHLALALVTLLCACQQTPQTASTSKVCAPQLAAELPVQLQRGFVLVPGALNRSSIYLLVDTGAEGSLVNATSVNRLGIDHDNLRRTTLRGIGGEVTNANVRLMSFTIGRMELLDQSMAVGSLPQIDGTDPPVGGLLGADFLSSYDLDMDLPHRKIALYRMGGGCTGGFAPWEQVASVVPLRRSYRNLLSLDVQIDGQLLSALVDSGARGSVMSMTAARRLGIESEALSHDPVASGRGVDQNDIRGHVHRFNEVRIGREVFRNIPIQIAPLRLQNVDMLLGDDYLRTRHFWISYATHRLFLAAPGT